MTRWWQLRLGRAGAGASEPPTRRYDSLVAVGVGEDWGWGEKPPTSHNDSLVAVGAGEDRGWGENHQQVITTRWWLEQGGPG